MKSKEERFLEKVKSDLQEGLFDLFTTHINEIGSSVKLYGLHSVAMIKLLEESIRLMKLKIHKGNTLFMYRNILIVANKLLFLDKHRKDIKEIKKEIIADYSHEESITEGYIPLDDQLTEVRITYDVSYLIYLVKKLIEEDKQYLKALYCFEAIKIIEPDNEIIDKYQGFFDKKIPLIEIPKNKFEKPDDFLLVLDSNVVISKILYDVGTYRIRSGTTFDLDKLENNNSFVILPSVVEEVKSHLKVEFYRLEGICFKDKTLNADEIKETLLKRFDKFVDKYLLKDELFEREDISKIKSFYFEDGSLLRTILEEKISRQRKRSHKLRRIAKRSGLLPEEGDLELLADCIALQKNTDKKIGILSKDADFQYFANRIKKQFNIEIVGD